MKLAATVALLFALNGDVQAQNERLRGRLRQEPGRPPVLETAGQKRYSIFGDEFTLGQASDPKLNGREIDLEGRFAGPDRFEATGLYTLKGGKRFQVTYWCEVCSIRTHMPGRCMCCQADTELQELPAP